MAKPKVVKQKEVPRVNWNDVFASFPYACYKLMAWLQNKPESHSQLTHDNFITELTKHNIIGNEEKLFYFFDDAVIYTEVFREQVWGGFVSYTQSEYQFFFCKENPTRRHGVVRCIINSMACLEERLNKQS